MIKQELIDMFNEKYIPNPLERIVNFEYAPETYNSSIDGITPPQNAEFEMDLIIKTFHPTEGLNPKSFKYLLSF